MINTVIFDLDGTLVQTEILVVTIDFTHKAVDESRLMEDRRIVSDPSKLLETVEQSPVPCGTARLEFFLFDEVCLNELRNMQLTCLLNKK